MKRQLNRDSQWSINYMGIKINVELTPLSPGEMKFMT